jgi:hypothetical protein
MIFSEYDCVADLLSAKGMRESLSRSASRGAVR